MNRTPRPDRSSRSAICRAVSGPRPALTDVSLSIPRGVVFGLVGTNGAGKTTLIKHAMGLMRAQAGSVSVFGLDPVSNPTAVLSRVGYLSELNELPEWMRVEELINFTRARSTRTGTRATHSPCGRTSSSNRRRSCRRSRRDSRARLGLLLALSYRPELLILDEPSSGLDPLVRRDILRAIIKTIAEEGRTVLFSSHLLDEVERVADRVLAHQRRLHHPERRARDAPNRASTASCSASTRSAGRASRGRVFQLARRQSRLVGLLPGARPKQPGTLVPLPGRNSSSTARSLERDIPGAGRDEKCLAGRARVIAAAFASTARFMWTRNRVILLICVAFYLAIFAAGGMWPQADVYRGLPQSMAIMRLAPFSYRCSSSWAGSIPLLSASAGDRATSHASSIRFR